MRIGSNPHRDQPKENSGYLHQVVIPVYIPNPEGYFADGLTILQRCLESLFGTAHDRTYITVVDNGSHEAVRDYLDGLFKSGEIHEIIHTDNVGKINAAMKGLSGHDMELLTIADADVMFLSGWQYATNEIFQAFPKAGVVGIVPQQKSFNRYCENIIYHTLFSKKLRFMPFPNPEALFKFYRSIGWEALHPVYSRMNLALDSGSGVTAFLGTGHFVSTYKRDIFEETAIHFKYKLGGDSEDYVDALGLKKDYWRLNTIDNYAYHMGNTHESWMDEMVFEKADAAVFKSGFPVMKKIPKLSFFVKNKIFKRIFFERKFKKLFYMYKKLPPDMIGKY